MRCRGLSSGRYAQRTTRLSTNTAFDETNANHTARHPSYSDTNWQALMKSCFDQEGSFTFTGSVP
jgi:hypothetical protein